MVKVLELHFRHLGFFCYFVWSQEKTIVDFAVPQFPHLTIQVANFVELNSLFFAKYVKITLGYSLLCIICIRR